MFKTASASAQGRRDKGLRGSAKPNLLTRKQWLQAQANEKRKLTRATAKAAAAMAKAEKARIAAETKEQERAAKQQLRAEARMKRRIALTASVKASLQPKPRRLS